MLAPLCKLKFSPDCVACKVILGLFKLQKIIQGKSESKLKSPEALKMFKKNFSNFHSWVNSRNLSHEGEKHLLEGSGVLAQVLADSENILRSELFILKKVVHTSL